MKHSVLILFLISLPFMVHSQENEEEPENQPKHLVMGSFGYTFVPKAAPEGSKEVKGVFVPSIGVDYFHRLNDKWEIGTMIDLELSNYIILHQELDREKALLVVALAGYKLTERVNVFGGGGIELEKHKNLPVFRCGAEYAFMFKNEWVLAPGAFYDLKEGYDTWSISLAFGKEF